MQTYAMQPKKDIAQVPCRENELSLGSVGRWRNEVSQQDFKQQVLEESMAWKLAFALGYPRRFKKKLPKR
jgi:hypothetical protein